MDTKRLQQFKILAETQNLREAAQHLNISHAGLGKSIRVLEEELGIKLITRDGRGMKITPLAKGLLAEMDVCLLAEEKLKNRALGLDVLNRKRVRIGTFEVFSTYVGTDVMQCLLAGSEIVFEELIPGLLEDALVRENVDIGITYIPIPRGELDHIEITKIRMGVFASKKLVGQDMAFKYLPFVVPVSSVEGPNKVRGLDGWPDDRIPRQVRYSVTLMETAIALVRRGLAVAYLPEFVVERHNQIVQGEYLLKELASPLKGARPQSVYAIKRKDHDEVASFRAVCKSLRKLK